MSYAHFRIDRRLGAAGLALLVAAACGGEQGAAPEPDALAASDTAAAPAAEEAPAAVVGPATDLPPNELGQIMVLEYHRLGSPEGEWYRTAENFRADLERLYQNGYRPVTMRQVIEGNIDVPSGTSPVVFTIDDSSQGQFYFREDGSIDPGTMVGIWSDFQRENPGWQYGAVWCVLPAADHPSNFFGDRPSREVPREEREATIRRKVEYLVKNEHEICNHTLYHARLDRARDDAQVQEWIGLGEDSIQAYLPDGYDIVTLALPLGLWPRNRSLAWRGTYGDGKTYEYEAVLEVSGGPNESPFDTGFDPHSVNRLIVAPGALQRQLDAYDRNPGRRYVSDGNVNTIAVPQELADRVDRTRWPNKEVRVVERTATPQQPNAAPTQPPG